MKNKIEDQLKSIMEVYKDPNEIIDLMENQDIDGHSSFFYMQKYSLYHILDSKIMDTKSSYMTSGEVVRLSTQQSWGTLKHLIC